MRNMPDGMGAPFIHSFIHAPFMLCTFMYSSVQTVQLHGGPGRGSIPVAKLI
jgi:hypothetical protein